MTATCPNGHSSSADDYCDVCGAPIPTGAAGTSAPAGAEQPTSVDTPAVVAGPAETRDVTGSATPADTAGQATSAATAPGGQVCPDCATSNTADALFCEGCGYDFTTRTSSRDSAAATSPSGDAAAAGASAGPADAAAVPGAGAPSFAWVAEVWIDPDWYAAQQATDPMPSPGLPAVVPLRKTSLLIGRHSQSRNIVPDIDCTLDTATSRRQAQLTTDGSRWFIEDLQSANGTFVSSASGSLPEDPITSGVRQELQADDRIHVGAWTRIVIRTATADEIASL
jgi:FHA domain